MSSCELDWFEGKCPKGVGGYIAGARWHDGNPITDEIPSSLVPMAKMRVKKCQWETGEPCDCPLSAIADEDMPRYRLRQRKRTQDTNIP